MNTISSILLFAGLSLQTGCSDPAVRLASCIGDAVKAGHDESSCKLGLPRGGVVVLHPDGNLTLEQLIAAGLTEEQAKAVAALRLGSFASIYVLSNDPQDLPSRTTSQRSYVRIPQILVLARSSNEPVMLTLAGPPGDRFVQSMR